MASQKLTRLALEHRPSCCAARRNRAPLVHFMPVVACQPGVGGCRPKLVCLPHYTTLTAETALGMCARGAQQGREGKQRREA